MRKMVATILAMGLVATALRAQEPEHPVTGACPTAMGGGRARGLRPDTRPAIQPFPRTTGLPMP